MILHASTTQYYTPQLTVRLICLVVTHAHTSKHTHASTIEPCHAEAIHCLPRINVYVCHKVQKYSDNEVCHPKDVDFFLSFYPFLFCSHLDLPTSWQGTRVRREVWMGTWTERRRKSVGGGFPFQTSLGGLPCCVGRTNSQSYCQCVIRKGNATQIHTKITICAFESEMKRITFMDMWAWRYVCTAHSMFKQPLQ